MSQARGGACAIRAVAEDLLDACGEAILELRARKIGIPVGQTRPDGHDPAGTARRRLRSADGEANLLVWRGLLQGVPPTAQSAIRGSCGAGRAEIGAGPSFGCRTVAGLPGMGKHTVQRIFQLKG